MKRKPKKEKQSIHRIMRKISTIPQPSWPGAKKARLVAHWEEGMDAYHSPVMSGTSQTCVSSCMWKTADSTFLWVRYTASWCILFGRSDHLTDLDSFEQNLIKKCKIFRQPEKQNRLIHDSTGSFRYETFILFPVPASWAMYKRQKWLDREETEKVNWSFLFPAHSLRSRHVTKEGTTQTRRLRFYFPYSAYVVFHVTNKWRDAVHAWPTQNEQHIIPESRSKWMNCSRTIHH